ALKMDEVSPKVIIDNVDESKYYISKTITEEDVIVTLKEHDTNLSYSWKFDRKMVGEELRLNFEVKLDSPKKEEIDSLSTNKDKLYLSFTHHGALPSEATINLYVGNKYKNGEKLYLYYYNEENKKIEYIDKNIDVENGYITFKINHCSEYFLTTTIVNDAVNNPKSMNYIIVGMVIVVLGLVAVTIFSTKK
ncbi:MAG: hypothetical protein RSE91_02510, partial [Bacilli bacterium]